MKRDENIISAIFSTTGDRIQRIDLLRVGTRHLWVLLVVSSSVRSLVRVPLGGLGHVAHRKQKTFLTLCPPALFKRSKQ